MSWPIDENDGVETTSLETQLRLRNELDLVVNAKVQLTSDCPEIKNLDGALETHIRSCAICSACRAQILAQAGKDTHLPNRPKAEE